VIDSTGLQKSLKKDTQKQSVACPKIEFSKKKPLRFERVNEVTWKLTDASFTDVPASHGQWGGYRTTRAIAWVMEVGPKQWVARCGDMASHPLPLAEAKRAAMRMVVSGLYDYRVTNADAPDLNNLTVQSNRANNQTNVVIASPRIEVLSDSEVESELLRYIIGVECGA
jgi:hypothetical protein